MSVPHQFHSDQSKHMPRKGRTTQMPDPSARAMRMELSLNGSWAQSAFRNIEWLAQRSVLTHNMAFSYSRALPHAWG